MHCHPTTIAREASTRIQEAVTKIFNTTSGKSVAVIGVMRADEQPFDEHVWHEGWALKEYSAPVQENIMEMLSQFFKQGLMEGRKVKQDLAIEKLQLAGIPVWNLPDFVQLTNIYTALKSTPKKEWRQTT